MGREHLEGRDVWQDEASSRGEKAEEVFDRAIRQHLTRDRWVLQTKPTDLRGIYGLHESGRPHGIQPDYMIRHPETGRAIYVEIKRQRAKGNAHERACKYFAPGIIQSAREIARIPDDRMPFWWIFTDGIAEDARYVREIEHWFAGIREHLLLWKSFPDGFEVIRHFDEHIRPMLEPTRRSIRRRVGRGGPRRP